MILNPNFSKLPEAPAYRIVSASVMRYTKSRVAAISFAKEDPATIVIVMDEAWDNARIHEYNKERGPDAERDRERMVRAHLMFMREAAAQRRVAVA